MTFTLVTAPPNYLWQEWLEKRFPGYRSHIAQNETRGSNLSLSGPDEIETKAKLDWKNTAIKWFTDCMIVGHIVNITAFLILMGIMKGHTGKQLSETLKNVGLS